MNKFNQLIIYLVAIQYFAKDIHYSVVGEVFYGQHLFADRIYEPLDNYIDSIKENCLLFEKILPLSGKEYLAQASLIIPERVSESIQNWLSMRELHIKTLNFIESIKNDLTTGEANLIGNIAENLNNNLGLLNLQCEKIENK